MSVKTMMTAGLLLASLASAQAADQILILPADLSEEDAIGVANALKGRFENLRAGDRLIGIVGVTGETIFDVNIPDEEIYAKHAGHRQKLMVPAWQKTVAHIKRAVEKGSKAAAGGLGSQVDLPTMLDQLRYRAENKPIVTVIGNPLYHDSRMPDFSMAKAYPNDAHFERSRAQTPFGTQGVLGVLDGMQFHFCTIGANWVNTTHEKGVEGAYGKMIAGYGAKLVTFGRGLSNCSNRAAAGDSSGAATYTLASNGEPVEMIDVTARVPDPGQVVSSGPISPELKQAIDDGLVRMANLYVFDTAQEDGDVVEIIAAGYSKHVALLNEPQKIEVPLTAGHLQVVGVKDGQGGITVGIRTEAGAVIVSDKIAPGARLDIPIPTN